MYVLFLCSIGNILVIYNYTVCAMSEIHGTYHHLNIGEKT